jgi:hypothetical protein
MHQKYEKFFLKIFVLCVVFFPFLLSCSEDLSTSEEKVESNIEENQDDVPPFVLEIIPSDGAVNLELDTSIEIKFSEEINTLKISVNGGVHSCSGTIQVSNDNFSTCVELISLENHNHENQKLIIRAKDNFSSLTQYKVRVLSDIEDLVGNKMINTVAHKVGFQTGDYLPPVITIVQKIDNHTNDSTPTLIINSNEDGMISSLKECGVIEQNISEGENTIKLSELEDGLYDDCDIYVYDSSNNLKILSIPSFIIDTKKPVVAMIKNAEDISSNKKPEIVFYSSENGVISFEGSCSSDINESKKGENTIFLKELKDGVYENCSLTVIDVAGNQSDQLTLSKFTIYTGLVSQQIGTDSDEELSDMVFDSQGNIILGGIIHKGSFSLISCMTKKSTGELSAKDIIIMKLTPSGVCEWIHQISSNCNNDYCSGTDSNDYLNNLKTDSSGNIYLVGKIRGQFENSSGFKNNDGIILKLNSKGDVVLSKVLGSDGSDSVDQIHVDNQQNLYIFGNTINLNAETFLFWMKFNKKFDLIWTKQIGIPNLIKISAVITMGASNFIIAANYYNPSNFKKNFWLLKIDTDGEKIWSNEEVQQNNININDMSSDNSGNIYLTGSVEKYSDTNDFYFVKYDSNGALVWDKNFGSDANDEITAIDFDGISSFYLTGFTEGNYKVSVNRGKKDFVYMKYTEDGTEESSYQFGTEEDDVLNSIIFRNSSEQFLAGYTYGKYHNFNNYGGSDFILFKFDENQILE